MKRTQWITTCFVMALLMGVVGWAGKDALSLPEAVQAALHQLLPGADIDEVGLEDEWPQLYEVRLVKGDVVKDVVVAKEGQVIEVETDLDEGALPETVRAAVTGMIPGAEIKKTEQKTVYAEIRIVVLAQPKILYEAEVLSNGHLLEVTVLSDGTVISTKADDEQKDEDGDNDEEGDDEEEVEMSIDQVPGPVKDTIMAQRGVAQEIVMENEDGQVVYDVELLIDGQEVELKIASDGTLLEKEVDNEDD